MQPRLSQRGRGRSFWCEAQLTLNRDITACKTFQLNDAEAEMKT